MGVCLLSVGWVVPAVSTTAKEHLRTLRTIRQLEIATAHIENGLVFLKETDVHPAFWYVRNPSDFRGPRIYASDLGKVQNEKVIKHFAGRALYEYSQGSLRMYENARRSP